MILPILFVVVSPFLVYYISTQLFYRTTNSKALGKRPPTIPYFIPAVFHTFTLAYEGAQTFFASAM